MRDWAAVKAHLTKARSVDPADGDAESALVALSLSLSLDHAYQAFETILVRLERAVGLPERVGVSWHTALLADAALDLQGVRPPVFPPQSLGDWDALLRFRHFLRHAYVTSLDPARLAANVERLEAAVVATDAWLTAVLTALRTV
jgi:hypothetical protein